MTTVYFVRHAEAEGNTYRRMHGQYNSLITENGVRQIEALERAVESTELLMQHGSTTYLEVLTAQQSLLSARLSQISDRFDEIQGIVNLYQALGGGRDITEEK